jgi:hypothetical protein
LSRKKPARARVVIATSRAHDEQRPGELALIEEVRSRLDEIQAGLETRMVRSAQRESILTQR